MARLLVAVSERDFQTQVLNLAHLFGWRIAHFRPAWTSKGYRTAMIGDLGWPDLAMVRGGRLVFAELKTDRGKLTTPQREWLWALAQTGTEVYVWRPCCWHQIEVWLR